MPPDVPQVTVADDPVVVFIMVALFAGAAILAVLFATPLFSRVPTDPPITGAARIKDSSPPARDALNGPHQPDRTPWSTTAADEEAPWPPTLPFRTRRRLKRAR